MAGESKVYLTWQGKTLSLTEWAETDYCKARGYTRAVLWRRDARKWDVNDIFTVPVNGRKRGPRKPKPSTRITGDPVAWRRLFSRWCAEWGV